MDDLPRGTYVVAVSGGIDSSALLHMLQSRRGVSEFIVAHVDHGIRDDSGGDARFVVGLAAQYGMECVGVSLRLGAAASEDTARTARYGWLKMIAKERKATLITAHHLDDLVGSIAINLHRGTRWRGLTVMSDAAIVRPLLGITKAELREYALRNRLEWVEDSTNRSQNYTRNRLRGAIERLPASKKRNLLALRDAQQMLRHHIDDELESIWEQAGYSRYFYTMVPQKAAIELLRHTLEHSTGIAPTHVTAERIIMALKSARPGTAIDVDGVTKISISSRQFAIHPASEVVH